MLSRHFKHKLSLIKYSKSHVLKNGPLESRGEEERWGQQLSKKKLLTHIHLAFRLPPHLNITPKKSAIVTFSTARRSKVAQSFALSEQTDVN
jgi:hypothetical protein